MNLDVFLQVGSNGFKQWRYYDYGPKSVAPLVCLSGVAGTADVFYKQILNLCLKVVAHKVIVMFVGKIIRPLVIFINGSLRMKGSY